MRMPEKHRCGLTPCQLHLLSSIGSHYSFWKSASILILRAAIIALLAVFADHLLEHTAWYRHFQEAGYKSAQYALMQNFSPPKGGLPVRMLDLSALIRRTQAPLVCGRKE